MIGWHICWMIIPLPTLFILGCGLKVVFGYSNISCKIKQEYSNLKPQN